MIRRHSRVWPHPSSPWRIQAFEPSIFWSKGIPTEAFDEIVNHSSGEAISASRTSGSRIFGTLGCRFAGLGRLVTQSGDRMNRGNMMVDIVYSALVALVLKGVTVEGCSNS